MGGVPPSPFSTSCLLNLCGFVAVFVSVFNKRAPKEEEALNSKNIKRKTDHAVITFFAQNWTSAICMSDEVEAAERFSWYTQEAQMPQGMDDEIYFKKKRIEKRSWDLGLERYDVSDEWRKGFAWYL